MTDRTALKFLVVDNFSTMRRIVRGLLKEFGFTSVEEAEDGVEAMQRLKLGGIDFVVSAWFMSNMNGLELLKSVRADPALKHLPMLMVFVDGQARDDIVAATQADASGVIFKPFSAERLNGSVEGILKKMGVAVGGRPDEWAKRVRSF